MRNSGHPIISFIVFALPGLALCLSPFWLVGVLGVVFGCWGALRRLFDYRVARRESGPAEAERYWRESAPEPLVRSVGRILETEFGTGE